MLGGGREVDAFCNRYPRIFSMLFETVETDSIVSNEAMRDGQNYNQQTGNVHRMSMKRL